MSLDVYLELDEPILKLRGSGIFFRKNGQTKQISRAEWDKKNLGRIPFVILQNKESEFDETVEVWHGNITSNLIPMARNCGLLDALWSPDKLKFTKASDISETLISGIEKLKKTPEKFKKLNPANGWGNYDVFLDFLNSYCDACIQYPEAKINIWA